jgi:hypothetical protein
MASLQLVDADTHRVLGYIDALVSQGYQPVPEEVEVYALAPVRRPAKVESGVFRDLALNFANLANFADVWSRTVVREEAEKWVEYLGRLRWAELDAGGVRLTKAGRALLGHLNSRLEGLEADEVLLVSPEDLVGYPKVIGKIARLENVMVVDPYLDSLSLFLLARDGIAKRVLTSSKMGKARLAELTATLAGIEPSARPQARLSNELHDRYVVGDGSVQMLGASLNGVGKSLTVLLPITGRVADGIRSTLESQWDSAEAISVDPKSQGRAATRTDKGRTASPRKGRPRSTPR